MMESGRDKHLPVLNRVKQHEYEKFCSMRVKRCRRLRTCLKCIAIVILSIVIVVVKGDM